MGVVALLLMWPGQFKHSFVSEGYIWNLVTMGLSALKGYRTVFQHVLKLLELTGIDLT